MTLLLLLLLRGPLSEGFFGRKRKKGMQWEGSQATRGIEGSWGA